MKKERGRVVRWNCKDKEDRGIAVVFVGKRRRRLGKVERKNDKGRWVLFGVKKKEIARWCASG